MAEITTKHLKTTYSQEEAFNSSLLYFKGDKLAARVWINKYALKDSQGNLYEKRVLRVNKRGKRITLVPGG